MMVYFGNVACFIMHSLHDLYEAKTVIYDSTIYWIALIAMKSFQNNKKKTLSKFQLKVYSPYFGIILDSVHVLYRSYKKIFKECCKHNKFSLKFFKLAFATFTTTGLNLYLDDTDKFLFASVTNMC